MPLVSVSERARQLLQAANTVKTMARQHADHFETANQSANAVLGLLPHLAGVRNNVLRPCVGDAAVAAKFAEELPALANVPLDNILGAIDTLLDRVFAAGQALIPQDETGRLLHTRWAADGTLDVLVLTPADTADLAGALRDLAAAIPGG